MKHQPTQTKAFQYHWRRTFNGKPAVCYSYYGPLDGWFPPSIGWRRVMIGNKILTAYWHKYNFDNEPLPLP